MLCKAQASIFSLTRTTAEIFPFSNKNANFTRLPNNFRKLRHFMHWQCKFRHCVFFWTWYVMFLLPPTELSVPWGGAPTPHYPWEQEIPSPIPQRLGHKELACISNFMHPMKNILLLHFRDGWRYQNGWIFGNVPKGGVIFNPNIYIPHFGPLRRLFGNNLQCDFPNMREGCQRPFGIFPKINLFRYGHLSLSKQLVDCPTQLIYWGFICVSWQN